ncbi:MAG TPA: 1-(5-phosphoribosyl)-5-[(5-phosphoribosylamino)methylideneamino] imidazole-4-carboxamide isomerase [Candidatus Limnocylindrales bacterium]|nr:1-(5-phosphoribosyl)-5-[(5-phosphoribosylamino)methylideneamino] imidazole-4-carboxamide isomerase [Candidatus Limnocylindrales bacterium]
MELIPAIDLRAGKVVRLERGEFDRETEYGSHPLAAVRRWVGEGATRLHIVDLDGARQGRRVQIELIERLVAAAGVPCQVAGGLRTDGSVAGALAQGADRVVLGSGLLADPGWAGRLVEVYGRERIVAALDVRDGLAVGEAWRPGARGTDFVETARRLHSAGIGTFVVTAIGRDGLLSGPDLDLLDRVADVVGAAGVIASGGVGSLADLRALARRGFGGAILGRALYDGRLALPDALGVVAQSPTGKDAARLPTLSDRRARPPSRGPRSPAGPRGREPPRNGRGQP